MDKNFETSVVYVVSLNLISGLHSDRAAQITSMLSKKVKILDEYLDFANVFSKEKALVLPECTELNKHTINLENDKQPLYGLIYSLSPGGLESLKPYIEIYLKTGFIRPSKSLTGAFILFDKKSDSNLYLCVDSQCLKNLIIKNRYLLPLIRKLLNRLGQAKRFI